ncbi:YjaG family protein [Salinicola aestuarinus]|uniref:YjaG family protein n=1 Tax=Salinicola aestuarinus TaxID=1949082 RepID=UPI000DA14EBC|nr:YjaG family protein [Salinicola aestuarinus]
MASTQESFNVRLRKLDRRQAIAFMAATAERLVPNYVLYAHVNAVGDPAMLYNVIDLVWESLNVKSAKIDFDKQAEKLAAIEPLSEDDSFGARRATETIMAVTTLLDALRSEASESVIDVSRVSRNGVRAMIEMSEGTEDAEQLDALCREHPLMQDEHDFQDAVLEAVENGEAMRDLRTLGRNGGVSNLGLTLD